MCVEPINQSLFNKDRPVGPLCARVKRQPYKDTHQWASVTLKTKAQVRFAINS